MNRKYEMRLVQKTLQAAFFLTAVIASPTIVFAEKADRSKEIVIDAARNTADQAKNVLVLEGMVTLEQGTMRITADKMTVKRDDQEFIFAELIAMLGKQITFREKREGFNDFMEGTADRAEFDDKARTIKLFTRAKLKTGNDVLTGDYIYYNSDTQVIQADGQAPSSKDGKLKADSSGRVRIVIQPRPSAAREPKTPAVVEKK